MGYQDLCDLGYLVQDNIAIRHAHAKMIGLNYNDWTDWCCGVAHLACIHCIVITESPARRQYLERYTLMEADLFCSPKFVRLQQILPKLVGKVSLHHDLTCFKVARFLVVSPDSFNSAIGMVRKGHRILIFSQVGNMP